MAKTFDDKKIIYTMDRVGRAYGTKVVLKDISISYYYGAKIGVLGSNGAGKSSLFKILAGIDKDYTGETSLALRLEALQWVKDQLKKDALFQNYQHNTYSRQYDG